MKWKNDAPYVLCLSHDVDRIKKQWYHYCYYGIKSPLVQSRSFINKLLGREPYWNFNRIIEIEEDFGVRSTFFFLNESRREFSVNFMGRYRIDSDQVISIIRELDRRGFEVGLHGSYDSYNNFELIFQEKRLLEQIVGHSIVSVRQHHLNFEEDVTWVNQARVGLKYDSTIGYNNKVGVEQFLRTGEGMIEIPITLMDTVVLDESVYNSCCSIFRDGGIVMLNFHQCHFNDIEYPKNVDMYIRLLKTAREDGAWIATVKEVGEWLSERI